MAKLARDKLEIRVMREEDLASIIDIDERVTGTKRSDYYELKMSQLLERQGQISMSLVAEYEGRVIGFIMGNIYMGEFGIPGNAASLDTIGVDPHFEKSGVGTMLLEDFTTNVEAAGARKMQTLVDLSNARLLAFFINGGFAPSDKLNLEKRIR
jgi:ribosomal protein S18 acetylase RimI-like enzyme